jgi:transcription antitermination factor NusG
MNALAQEGFAVAGTAQWLVLRCSHAQTLRLADSLSEAGIEAWAPRELVVQRARRNHKREETVQPIMPGYVFAGSGHLHELLALIHSPAMLYQVWDAEQRRMVTKGHPHFRFFQPWGEPETIRESQLANLRRLDGLRRPKGPLRTWKTGERVRLTDGAYAGLSGTVVKWAGEHTTIEIDGWTLQPTVSTRLLRPGT